MTLSNITGLENITVMYYKTTKTKFESVIYLLESSSGPLGMGNTYSKTRTAFTNTAATFPWLNTNKHIATNTIYANILMMLIHICTYAPHDPQPVGVTTCSYSLHL